MSSSAFPTQSANSRAGTECSASLPPAKHGSSRATSGPTHENYLNTASPPPPPAPPTNAQTHKRTGLIRRVVRGVYFQLSNDQPHPAIKDWKVTTYKVSRAGHC